MSETLHLASHDIVFERREPVESTSPDRVPFLFAHGKFFNSDIWLETGTLDTLAQEGHTAVAFDVPGEAFEKTRSRGPKPDDVPSFVAELCLGLDLDKPIGVFPSLSGPELALPYLYSKTSPSLLRGMVLVAPVQTEELHIRPFLQWNIPALVIWGSEDDVVPVENAFIVGSQFSHATVAIMEGGKHAPYVQNPDGFNKLLALFGENPKQSHELFRTASFEGVNCWPG